MIVGAGDVVLRPVRRDDRDHLGADRESRASARRRVAAGLLVHRASASIRSRSSPAAAERTATACWPRAARRRSVGRHLARPGADVRNRRPAAHPHAVLYGAGRANGADIGRLRDRVIGFFYLLTFILGFGAMVLVGRDAIPAIDAGGNMAAPLLAEALGGTPFLGFIAAVAFATILAVVAGLTLSGAAALSHDLWVNVFRGATPTSASSCASRASRRSSSASSRSARDRVQGPERRVHGGAGVRDRGEREFPGARAVDLLAASDDRRSAGQHADGTSRRSC